MLHHGKGLTLGIQASQNLSGVHAQFDQLEGDASVNRLRLFGEPNLTHTTFPKELEEPVGADLFLLMGGTRV
jgi:hypothetical protein